MNKLNLKRKQPFLLLEVLAAFTMLIIAGSLIGKVPSQNFKNAKDCFIQLEMERIAALSLIEIKNTFLQKHSWESISKETKQKPFHKMADINLDIGPLKQTSLKRTYTLWVRREKKNAKGEIFRLLGITFFLETTTQKNTFTYSLLSVKKLDQPSSEPSLKQEIFH